MREWYANAESSVRRRRRRRRIKALTTEDNLAMECQSDKGECEFGIRRRQNGNIKSSPQGM